MRIMTIHALDMARRHDGWFRRVMRAGGDRDRMAGELVEFAHDVTLRDVSGMTGAAIVFFHNMA